MECNMSYSQIKSVAEWVISLLLLLVLSPLIMFIVIILAFYGLDNIVFIQSRTGKHLKTFKLIKFKTMRSDPDGRLEDADRLTAFGRFLRSTSLDELPQLFNVLAGQMTLIGPRPLLPEYLTWYHRNELSRFTVKPGITGLAQVRGRNTLPWKHRLRYDVFYAHKLSFSLDFLICLETIKALFSRKTLKKHNITFSHRLDVERRNGLPAFKKELNCR